MLSIPTWSHGCTFSEARASNCSLVLFLRLKQTFLKKNSNNCSFRDMKIVHSIYKLKYIFFALIKKCFSFSFFLQSCCLFWSLLRSEKEIFQVKAWNSKWSSEKVVELWHCVLSNLNDLAQFWSFESKSVSSEEELKGLWSKCLSSPLEFITQSMYQVPEESNCRRRIKN